MADYFTSFACTFDLGSPQNVARAVAIAAELEDELDGSDRPSLGFKVEPDAKRPGVMRIYDGDGFGKPENVIAFARLCAKAFGLTGRWGFGWGLWCSSSRTNGFGGGAHVLDLATGETVAWMDCDHWLATLLDPGTDPSVGVVLA